MKRTMLSILGVLILMSSMSAVAFAELKIGYIRPNYIFSLYEPYQEAQDKLSEFEDAEIAKLEKMQTDLQADAEKYQTQANMLSAEVQQARQQELLTQQQVIEETYNELTTVGGIFDQKQQELISPIIDDINDILMELGDVEEYDFILDANAGGVIFANEQYDVSDRVLDELKKGFTAE